MPRDDVLTSRGVARRSCARPARSGLHAVAKIVSQESCSPLAGGYLEHSLVEPLLSTASTAALRNRNFIPANINEAPPAYKPLPHCPPLPRRWSAPVATFAPKRLPHKVPAPAPPSRDAGPAVAIRQRDKCAAADLSMLSAYKRERCHDETQLGPLALCLPRSHRVVSMPVPKKISTPLIPTICEVNPRCGPARPQDDPGA